ncbi:hypothetical protein AXG93_1615s1090 [Marchantia polymorpha subsp. ruderalis]|uniref:Uncharacterized protein n=1 Tax=Marchantia polymorpha subsp. ruderalis TaxID=1480154 RepID=A0A176VX39_MARPO|nr:hypothetical protein AXG93_1615s1090 [Marchantia polymorpha subsp. ruderalis]
MYTNKELDLVTGGLWISKSSHISSACNAGPSCPFKIIGHTLPTGSFVPWYEGRRASDQGSGRVEVGDNDDEIGRKYGVLGADAWLWVGADDARSLELGEFCNRKKVKPFVEYTTCDEVQDQHRCEHTVGCRWCKSEAVDDGCFLDIEALRLPKHIFTCPAIDSKSGIVNVIGIGM